MLYQLSYASGRGTIAPAGETLPLIPS
jgi:hypothetical protein